MRSCILNRRLESIRSQITMIGTLPGTVLTFWILDLPCASLPIGILSHRHRQPAIAAFGVSGFSRACIYLRQFRL